MNRMKVMIVDNNVILEDDDILGQLFASYLNEKTIGEIKGEADLRCAVKAYSHYVLNVLVDRYGIGERESEL